MASQRIRIRRSSKEIRPRERIALSYQALSKQLSDALIEQNKAKANLEKLQARTDPLIGSLDGEEVIV